MNPKKIADISSKMLHKKYMQNNEVTKRSFLVVVTAVQACDEKGEPKPEPVAFLSETLHIPDTTKNLGALFPALRSIN